MAFIVPIVAQIFTGISTFVAGLGIVGQGLLVAGANIALGYINKMRSKKRSNDNAGVQFERQYGADVPRQVAAGIVGIAGHDCYVNTFGSSNKFLQQIYVVSDYYTSGLKRIAINGEYVSLGTIADPQKGFPVVSGEREGKIWVKFFDGRQTTADQYLTNEANPSGRWGANHIGLGVSFVLISMTYDQETNNNFPDFFFEVYGAPFYDFRKDSTNGGSGNHRFNDVSTHEFTENPAVIEYNYRRGLSVNGDLFCGMGMSPSDLPADKFTIAANLCDEIKADGQPAYRVSVMINCTETHGSTLETLGVSCGAMHVDSMGGSYPLVGSAQPIVATISDFDLVVGQEIKYKARRSMADLINVVAGNYPDPEMLWSMVAYEVQQSPAAIVVDRRNRDVAIDFPQVRHGRQAAQLAAIALKENRYEATASITVKSRYRGLEAGDWIRWNSDLYGSRTWLVTSRQLVSLDDEDQPRCVLLELQERDGSIYDNVTPPNIVVPYPPARPQYLQEVDFSLVPIYVQGDNGGYYSAIRVSWPTIDDVTVSNVMIEYWIKDKPQDIFTAYADGKTVVILTEAVVSETIYMVRTKIVPSPSRPTVMTVAKEIKTLASSGSEIVDYEDLSNSLQDLLNYANEGTRELWDFVKNLQVNVTNMQFDRYKDIQEHSIRLQSSFGEATAKLTQQWIVATSEIEALALVTTELTAALGDKADASTVDLLMAQVVQDGEDIEAISEALTMVNASFDGGVSSGAIRMTASAGTGGVKTRLAMTLRASVQDQFREAGMYWNVTPTSAEMMFLADKFVFWNQANDTLIKPFVIQDGVLVGTGLIMDWANIRNVQIKSAQIENGAITSAKIGDLQVKTSNLDFNQVTELYQNGGQLPNRSKWSSGTYDYFTIVTDNPQGNTCMIEMDLEHWFEVTYASGTYWVTLGVYNKTTNKWVQSERKGWSGQGAKGTIELKTMVFDESAVRGANEYAIRMVVEALSSSWLNSDSNYQSKIKALVWKR